MTEIANANSSDVNSKTDSKPVSQGDSMMKSANRDNATRQDRPFKMTEEQLAEYNSDGHYLYSLTLDLINGSHTKFYSPMELVKKARDTGNVIDGFLQIEELGDLENPIPDNLQFQMLSATVLDPEIMTRFWNLPPEQIQHLNASAMNSPTVTIAETAKTVDSPEVVSGRPSNNGNGSSKGKANAASGESTANKNNASETSDSSTKVEANIRVAVSVLDRLMNLAGELVLGRNQLLQTIARRDTRGLESVGAGLDRVTSELQEAIMQTRMQSIGTVFNKFTRVVRDLSNTLEKKCELIIEGKDV